MPLDPAIADLLQANLLANHQSGTQNSTIVDRNLVQALGVIQNTVVQSVASTADDAQLMGALRTSIYVPERSGGGST